jgi:antitoxin ParD1/3/4
MTSSLHVSLPDEMRAYVDLRTAGKEAYATPSEYVRALIREDMERESERLYVFQQLLKSADDVKHGRLLTMDDVKLRTGETIEKLRRKSNE